MRAFPASPKVAAFVQGKTHLRGLRPVRTYVASRQQEPSSDGMGGASYKEMSPEARQVFKEAQENILALNGSRMRALQELKVANEKIAELEQKLEDAVAQISNLQERRLDPAAGEPPAQGAPAGSQLCLIYSTGWDTAYVHYQLDDKPWTALPGTMMKDGDGAYAGKKKIDLVGNRLEFVLTNGSGKFDSPNPYGEPGHPKNYVIEAPGVWELEGGKLRRLA